MITKDMDKKINDYTRGRGTEKNGRSIYIVLKTHDKVFGKLVSHKPNIFIVEDQKDGILKEVHRATIVRFMIVVEGGRKDGWKPRS